MASFLGLVVEKDMAFGGGGGGGGQIWGLYSATFPSLCVDFALVYLSHSIPIRKLQFKN